MAKDKQNIHSALRLVERVAPPSAELENLLSAARVRVSSMTVKEVQQMHDLQRESYVRGEMGMGING